MLSTRVRLSTLVLATVGMFDLVSTLVWLNAGFLEGNPLFAPLAQHGSLLFALAKVAFLAGPLMALEWARSRRPVTAEVGTWVAAVAYIGLWSGHVLSLNG